MPNLEVIKAMQSLTSKGLVKTQFSWQWYYYVLTPEGVEYLREWYVGSSNQRPAFCNVCTQAPLARRDRPRHPHQAAAIPRPAPRYDG